MVKSKRLKMCIIDPNLCKDYDLKHAMDYDYHRKIVMNKG